MPQISKIGDKATGTCTNHQNPQSVTGVIVSSTNSVVVDGVTPVAVLGDIVQFDCGHSSFIASGTSIVTANGKPLAHVGCLVSGNGITGQVTTGSSKIIGI
jgi:uncharacterized Zn-binding protein involved in type VI secretion